MNPPDEEPLGEDQNEADVDDRRLVLQTVEYMLGLETLTVEMRVQLEKVRKLVLNHDAAARPPD